jgi:hypothetical protein
MSLRHGGVSGRHPVGMIWCQRQAQYLRPFARCILPPARSVAQLSAGWPWLPVPLLPGLSSQIPPTLPALLTGGIMRTGRRHFTLPDLRLHTRNGREHAMRIRRPGTGRFLTEAKATWDAGCHQRS